MIRGDTIAAIATPRGRGGVSVVRVSGPDAFEIAERLTKRRVIGPFPLVRFATIYAATQVNAAPIVIDQGLLLAFHEPRSYTGEDVCEFQCHGGTVTPDRVLKACLTAGARLSRRGEFTQRAFLNGKIDYDQAESILELVDAKTERAADIALEGLSGRKVRLLRTLYDTTLDLSARIEHALDIDEGDLPHGFTEDVRHEIVALRRRIDEVLHKAGEGKLLREGALVVLAGPPNAGKSSLMNALLEENRAIVSDSPGTTRDSIEEWLDLDGWPIRLVDTAGLRKAEDAVEIEGVKRAEALIAKADVVICLGESDKADERCLAVHSKCDLGAGAGLNVSAMTGEGLDKLKLAIVDKLKMRAEKFAHSCDGALDRLEGLCEVLSILSDPALSADPFDLVLAGNALHRAAECLGVRIGAVYSADLLDNLFSRFCVGK